MGAQQRALQVIGRDEVESGRGASDPSVTCARGGFYVHVYDGLRCATVCGLLPERRRSQPRCLLIDSLDQGLSLFPGIPIFRVLDDLLSEMEVSTYTYTLHLHPTPTDQQ